jgi:hypothetical protein
MDALHCIQCPIQDPQHEGNRERIHHLHVTHDTFRVTPLTPPPREFSSSATLLNNIGRFSTQSIQIPLQLISPSRYESRVILRLTFGDFNGEFKAASQFCVFSPPGTKLEHGGNCSYTVTNGVESVVSQPSLVSSRSSLSLSANSYLRVAFVCGQASAVAIQVTFHASRIMHLTAHVTYHISHGTCHMVHVTCLGPDLFQLSASALAPTQL